MAALCKVYKGLKIVLRSKEITLKEKISFYVMCLFKKLLITYSSFTNRCTYIITLIKIYI